VTQATAAPSTHDRIVRAAIELTTEEGWAALTMTRLADHAGVSRQTVYNEVGTKAGLAQAMVLDELSRFLAVVDDGFERNPEDLPGALRASVRGVLRTAESNELLRAIVSPGGGGELLPPLTTEAGALLDTAKTVVLERISAYDVNVDQRTLLAVVDMLVRTVLGHVMQPSGPPGRTADDLAELTCRLLDIPA
jgi:AcrR family transcriptional regulator